MRLWVRFPPGAGLFTSSILSNVYLHMSLIVEKIMPRCAAWGKISFISTVWDNKKIKRYEGEIQKVILPLII